MQSDLRKLREAALSVASRSPVGMQVEDIVLEADRDDDGTDFLRVVVRMKTLDKTNEADIEELLNNIEGAVSALDERFPSVRFADAA